MCKSKAEGGHRCAEHNPAFRSRQSLLNKKAYRESKNQDTSDIDHQIELLHQAVNKFGDNVHHHAMTISPDVNTLVERLSNQGFTPLIVGGSVRDSMAYGKEPKDIDIEIHGVDSVDNLKRTLRSHGYRVNEVGRSFGVLKTILPDGTDIDLSLPRRDNLVGSGHRGFTVDIDPDLSLEEAAQRRDFTINAMYYDASHQAIVDPYGGVEDYEKKVLRHVSDAYAEDPLRVLRGMQFASRFNLDMAPETIAESNRIKDQFDTLSVERIRGEWNKFLGYGAGHLDKGLTVLKQTGWDEKLKVDGIDIPKVSSQMERVLKLTKSNDAMAENSKAFATAVMMHHLPADRRRPFVKMTLEGDNNQKKALALVNSNFPEERNNKSIARWARQLKRQNLTVREWSTYQSTIDPDNKDVSKIADIARKRGVFDGPAPVVVSGDDIMRMTTERSGPWVGQLLNEINNAQDDKVFTSREEGLSWLESRLRELGK